MHTVVSVVAVSALLAALPPSARGLDAPKPGSPSAETPETMLSPAGPRSDFLPAAEPPAKSDQPPTTRKGLMIAGWSTLGGGYLLSALVGLLIIQKGLETESDPTRECLNCDTTGPYMLIPLVGPFMAVPDADGMDGKIVSGILGGVQVVGLTLGIIGTIMFVQDRAEYKRWEQGQIALTDDWYLSTSVASTGLADGRRFTPVLQLGTSF